MKTIRNMKDLERAMQPVLAGMVNEVSERFYQTLNYSFWIIIMAMTLNHTAAAMTFYGLR